jgi:hypothetical protein
MSFGIEFDEDIYFVLYHYIAYHLFVDSRPLPVFLPRPLSTKNAPTNYQNKVPRKEGNQDPKETIQKKQGAKKAKQKWKTIEPYLSKAADLGSACAKGRAPCSSRRCKSRVLDLCLH